MKRIKLSGFLIFETVIAFCIIGAISALIFPMLKTAIYYQKVSKTNRSFDRIFASIACFVEQNDRIPKPSLDESGREDLSSERVFGLVPFQTLLMEKQTASNGDGNILYYIANINLSSVPIRGVFDDPQFMQKEDPSHSIEIEALKTPSNIKFVAKDSVKDFIAVVLISIPKKSHIEDVVVVEKNGKIFVKNAPNNNIIIRWASRNNLKALYSK